MPLQGAAVRARLSPLDWPGEDVWVGVDVGGERSASAVVWINERLQVGCAIYHGDEGVLECVDKVRELALGSKLIWVLVRLRSPMP